MNPRLVVIDVHDDIGAYGLFVDGVYGVSLPGNVTFFRRLAHRRNRYRSCRCRLCQGWGSRVARQNSWHRGLLALIQGVDRMSRPPVFPTEDKIRIVLSVLAGELTIAEAAQPSDRCYRAEWSASIVDSLRWCDGRKLSVQPDTSAGPCSA